MSIWVLIVINWLFAVLFFVAGIVGTGSEYTRSMRAFCFFICATFSLNALLLMNCQKAAC